MISHHHHDALPPNTGISPPVPHLHALPATTLRLPTTPPSPQSPPGRHCYIDLDHEKKNLPLRHCTHYLGC